MFAFLDILTGIQATTYIKIVSIQISLKEHCIIQVLTILRVETTIIINVLVY
jgi:hypothetical protein